MSPTCRVLPKLGHSTGRSHALLLLSAIIVMLACGHDGKTPQPTPVSPAPPPGRAELPFDGGDVPEQVVEGDNAIISVWGTVPDPTWVLERLEVKVVLLPQADQPGRIEITAIGHERGPGEVPPGGIGPDGSGGVVVPPMSPMPPPDSPPPDPGVPTTPEVGADSSGTSTAFVGVVTLPQLQPGQYVVVLHGPGDDQEFPLRVIAGDSLIRFTFSGDASGPMERLIIRHDGSAVAFRAMEGPRARLMISPESLNVIIGWFREAGFAQLQDEYVSGEHRSIYEVALDNEGTIKRVVAEPDLMPQPLTVLVRRLHGILEQVLGSVPELPAVYGEVSVDPIEGDPGSARTLRLRLVNNGTNPVTLTFPTTQTYDFQILGMGHMGPAGEPTDPWYPGGGMGSGGTGGGCPGPDSIRTPVDPMPADDPEPMPPDSIPGMPPNLIWIWSADRAFEPVVTTITLAPGESRTFEETWSGQNNQGEPVGPGAYMTLAPVPADVPVPVMPGRFIINGQEPPPLRLAATLNCEPLEGPPGTPRTLTLAVTNLGEQRVDVQYPSTQRYDFAVFDPRSMGPVEPDGTPGDSTGTAPGPIWIWSANIDFNQVVGTETWAPGETKTYTEIWNGSGPAGVAVPPGAYAATAHMTGRPSVPLRPIGFVVTRP
jgi:hypothetical protein